MKEESNCFGLIIWIQAARGYTHLLRALSGWRDAGMEERRDVERGGGGGEWSQGKTRQHPSLCSQNGKKKSKTTHDYNSGISSTRC